MSITPQLTKLDQSDERLSQSQGLSGTLGAFWRSVKAGDVGALPVVVGLLIIGTIFLRETKNRDIRTYEHAKAEA